MNKNSFLSVLLVGLIPFLIPGRALAEDNITVSQNRGIAAPNRAFPGPGSPWAAPSGKVWVPGHYEINGDQKTWIRGHYKQIEDNSTTSQPGTLPETTQTPGPNPAQQPLQEDTLSPLQTQTAKKWIPGHFEDVSGEKIWVRGHYDGEQVQATEPPETQFDRPATATPALADDKEKVTPQGWAVVIGISKYKFASGNFPEIRYAAKDATEFYNFLRSPEGGGFSSDHVLFLKNEEANLQNIKYAFFDFLRQALEEDFVIIYFSGHGTPEMDNQKNLYLMAYDSKPDLIASTAFPMWDIETALTRYIKSEKVILLADACHSAGIATDISMRNIYQKNMVNRYIMEVGKAKKGRAIFTASEAGELSQESQKWGGGHGVFTYYLINALKGQADVNNNKIVSLGEVIDFVSENVRRATNNSQHPDTAGIFDREFPLAVIP
jgi:uncharacterized caspase-like protein